MIPINYSHFSSFCFQQPVQSSTQPSYFKNHQGWQINAKFDQNRDSLIFNLRDSYGLSHNTSEFIVEDLNSLFEEELQQKLPEHRLQFIYHYLQERLYHANPYQVHIEYPQGILIIRFGGFGLKGGGKTEATIFSLAQFATGVVLSATTGGGFLIVGGMLVSSGISSGLYAAKAKEDYNDTEYAKQTVYGAVTGLVSGGIGTLAQGADTVIKIGCQALGSAAGNVASVTASEIVEKGQLPDGKVIVEKACIGGIGGGVGAMAGSAMGSLMNQVGTETADDITTIALNTIKKAAEGATNSASCKAATNACEGKDLGNEVLESVLVGGLVSGCISGVEQAQRMQNFYPVSEGPVKIDPPPDGMDPIKQLLGLQEGAPAKMDPEIISKLLERGSGRGNRVHGVMDPKIKQLLGLKEGAPAKVDPKMINKLLEGAWYKGNGIHGISEQNSKFNNFSHNLLINALKPNPISIIDEDCTREELIPHIVLVQALSGNVSEHYINSLSEFERGQAYIACEDKEYRDLYSLKGVITPQGEIGHHLNLRKQEFKNGVDRPHMHWSWNQLVQPNGGTEQNPVNNWEDSPIAILEPLSTFENGVYYRPFGIAPYDTFTLNPHHLSKKSTIIVPQSLEQKARTYLAGFQGQIYPYQGTLRSAVIDALKNHYPETWHICNGNGEPIGEQKIYSSAGYSYKTCLKKPDGKIIVLINNEGFEAEDQPSTAFKEFKKSGRYIGLHANQESLTVWLEDKPYFQMLLKEFIANPLTAKNNSFCAGSVKDVPSLNKLGALDALAFYQKAQKFDKRTGIIEVANYVIDQAMYADLVSLFYQKNPNLNFDLSSLDVNMIFAPMRIFLITLLDDTKDHLHASDLIQKERSLEFFKSYCSMLEHGLVLLQAAKQETQELLKKEKEKSKSKDELKKLACLLFAQKEWEQIITPDDIQIDMGKNWPFNRELSNYIDKIMRLISRKRQDLLDLYVQIGSLSPKDQKEQYRLNIIASHIRWSLQENIYLDSLKKSDDFNDTSLIKYSILVNKLSPEREWLSDYGLYAQDFTKNIGDCLFDNVALQLEGYSENNHASQQLRQEVVNFMCEHTKNFSKYLNYNENTLLVGDGSDSLHFENWQQYLDCISIPQVWATELELQALSFKLDSPIVLLSINMNPKIYNPDGKNTPLFLHHTNENHFEACLPLKGLEVEEIYKNIKDKKHF